MYVCMYVLVPLSCVPGSLTTVYTYYYNMQSMIPLGTKPLATACAAAFFGGTYFRTPFGELTRALGMSLILVLQRTSRIRRTYPTWRYVPAFFGMGRRVRPFPPARNPWRYTPRTNTRYKDPDFSMLYSVIAMALVGSSVGGNLPMVPTWIGGLVGALMFAYGCTLSSPRGDLCRTLGMRVVAILQELWEIQADLKMIPKAAVVASQVLDKAMIFDRKHKVKDRFLSLVTKGYEQVMTTMSSASANPNPNQQREGERRDASNSTSSRESEEKDARRRPDDRGARGERRRGIDDDDRFGRESSLEDRRRRRDDPRESSPRDNDDDDDRRRRDDDDGRRRREDPRDNEWSSSNNSRDERRKEDNNVEDIGGRFGRDREPPRNDDNDDKNTKRRGRFWR
jgi:hypothetical protein